MKCKEFEIHYLVFEIFNEARNIFGIAKPLVKFSLAERAGLAADCCVVHTILLSLNWNEIIKIKHLINKGLDEEYTTKIKEVTPEIFAAISHPEGKNPFKILGTAGHCRYE